MLHRLIIVILLAPASMGTRLMPPASAPRHWRRRSLQSSPRSTPTKMSLKNATQVGDWLSRSFMFPLVQAFDKSGLDRGDFRAEFLVPWLAKDEELTQTEQVTVGITFIFGALALQVAVDPDNTISDNLSYIFFFLSYAAGTSLTFRLVAIQASVFEIFSHLVEKPQGVADFVPVIYNILFVIINSYYALRSQLGKVRLNLAADEDIYQKAFEPIGIQRSQFRQLMDMSESHVVTENEGPKVVFSEGTALTKLFLTLNCKMDIVKGGVPVTTLEPYQLIGEVALLENLKEDTTGFAARATLMAEPGARYLSWTHTDWYSLMRKDADFAYATQLMISRTLSRKLGKAREEQAMLCDTAFSLFDQDSSGIIDASELRAALRAIGISMEHDEVAKMLKMYDTDGCGGISLGEFRALVRDLPELVQGSQQGIFVD